MEYTPMEKSVLEMMQRANFKNMSKGDVIRFASKIEELHPEVAKEVLEQFPEFVGLMKSTLTDYKGMLETIVSSDDDSLKEYYNIANKTLDHAADSREQFIEIIKQALADCSKGLDNPNLSPEMIMTILNREVELVKIISDKDAEIRQQEKEVEEKANNKDAEKRKFSWKLVGGISLALISFAGIAAGVLGGDFDFQLPKKD